MKNIEDFNSALMLKWKWRILGGEKAKWAEVLSARYGDIQRLLQCGDAARNRISASAWWNDLKKWKSDITEMIL